MKYSLLLVALLIASSLVAQASEAVNYPEPAVAAEQEMIAVEEMIAAEEVLREHSHIRISVTGQGVAPMNTSSPAQAYALAKRAATADAYRLIAEKVKGVRIDGHDLIREMMVKRSTVRTSVIAMVKNASIVETVFKEGLCEVEMEIILTHTQFAQ